MLTTPVVLLLALGVDRAFGDPRTSLHPVVLIGRFIGWWGIPSRYQVRIQKITGVFFWAITALLFTTPFLLFSWYAPWYLILVAGPFLLKSCFALRSLQEHAIAVVSATDLGEGRERAQMLVSRDTSTLTDEQILSAAYESVAENLNDSIIAPLFYFTLFGLPGAALYRASNTMDAMLGYRDERERLGWFSARMDDIFSFIPARITGLLLILYFAARGRGPQALRIFFRDRLNRPGFNGGIPMSLIAGGTGIRFDKPGKYRIGDSEQSLQEAGPSILATVRNVTLLYAIIAASALLLLNLPTNV
ncbi:MAG TPA: adenosylcobinamide-phosphate synthase CbiB [Methanospirillum sp.]|nr:adenosylcobinamide-phosphate synthase CbiB [Methanospirillum sp.]